MNYRFKQFWESFYDLTAAQKESTRQAWKIFKQNPRKTEELLGVSARAGGKRR